MSTTNPTAAELLTAVNAAILALLATPTKSVSLNNRTYVYRDLQDLRELRVNLQQECRTQTGTVRLGDIS